MLSKLLWAVLAPESLLLLLLLAGTGLLFTSWKKIGRVLLIIAVMGYVTVAVLPVDQWLIRPLEERFSSCRQFTGEVQGVILLGGAEETKITVSRKSPSLNGSAERLIEFQSLAQRLPKARLAYTGGGYSRELADVVTGKSVLKSMGLDLERVVIEDLSLNTFQSAHYLKEIVQPAEDRSWLLVTSAYHIPRAMGAFRKAGWNVVAYPVDYRSTVSDTTVLGYHPDAMGLLSVAVKEWVGLAAYYMMGRTAEFFPEQVGEMQSVNVTVICGA